MALSPTRASQITCTGSTILIIGAVTIGLCVVLALGENNLGSVLETGAAYWAGIPVTVAGIIGILAGTSKKNILVKLFLLFSAVSLVLGVVMSVFIGLLLRRWRSRGDCSYTFCPFDEVSILLIILLTNCALLCILSVTGIIESSLPGNTDQDSEVSEHDTSITKSTSSKPPRSHVYQANGHKSRGVVVRGQSYHKAIDKQFKDDLIPHTAV